MTDKVFSHQVPRSRKELQHARRKAGLLKGLHDPPSGDRREPRRLKENAVARNDPGGDHACRYGNGEVPGRNDHPDPLWLVPVLVVLTGVLSEPLWQAEPFHLLSVIFKEVYCLGNVSVSLFP